MEREYNEPDELEFLDCPETRNGETCNLPAQVLGRYSLGSTGGSLEHVRTICPEGHPLNAPASMFGEGVTEPESEKPDRQEDVA